MKKLPANHSDYPPITICFNEPEIALLFAELVEAQGFQALITTPGSPPERQTKIITESNLFDSLPSWAKENCMVVSDAKAQKAGAAVTLIRPLSEERIESAFTQFLSKKLQ